MHKPAKRKREKFFVTSGVYRKKKAPLFPLFFFLLAITIGCLPLFMVGCGRQTEPVEPLCISCTADAKSWLEEVLQNYKELNPDFLYQLKTLPYFSLDEVTQQEEEAALQFRTEVLAGRGPDLLWISPGSNYLFPDPKKSMESGVFCDLAALNEQYGGLEWKEIPSLFRELGRWEEKQYILPVGWGPMGTVRYGEEVTLSMPASLEEYQRLSGYPLTIKSSYARAPACLMAGGEDAFGPLLESYTRQVAKDRKSVV